MWLGRRVGLYVLSKSYSNSLMNLVSSRTGVDDAVMIFAGQVSLGCSLPGLQSCSLIGWQSVGELRTWQPWWDVFRWAVSEMGACHGARRVFLLLLSVTLAMQALRSLGTHRRRP